MAVAVTEIPVPQQLSPDEALDSRSGRQLDPRRYFWVYSALVAWLPLLGMGLARHTGRGIFWWSTPLFVFVWFPILDVVSGQDRGNPVAGAEATLERDPYYRWCAALYVPLQYAGLAVAAWEWTHAPLSPLDRAGLVLTVGAVAGIGINTAHELGHKRERLELALARLGLAPTAYGHFLVEHNRGHHVRVATPEDPASARLGEGFWRFWPRTVGGGVASAWRLEAHRLRLRGGRVLSSRNEVLRSWAITVVLAAALVAWVGPGVLPFLVLQGVVGFTLLEAVNYLEHYGLARQRRPDGRYEPVDPRHSWNSDAVLSNVALFQLQRHSDHHANPRRRFQVLRSFEASPQLPYGYASMVPLALVPPLWRRVMDHRVVAHYDGDLLLANVFEPARARLVRRFPPGVELPAPRPPRPMSVPPPTRLAVTLGGIAVLWTLAYCWDLVAFQQQFGGWNYLAGLAFFPFPKPWSKPAAGRTV